MDISNDNLRNIARYMKYSDLINYCREIPRYQFICDSNQFWKEKFAIDYGPASSKIKDWKEAYRECRTLVRYAYGGGKFGGHPFNVEPGEVAMLSLPLPKALAVVDSKFATFVITEDNDVWAFNFSDPGLLGLGDHEEEIYDNQALNLSDFWNLKVKAMSCGDSHTLLIDIDDNVWGFGSNRQGQLAKPAFDGRIYSPLPWGIKAKMVFCSGSYSTLVEMDDVVSSAGYGTSQLPMIIPSLKVKMISGSVGYVLMIDFANRVWYYSTETGLLMTIYRAKYVNCGVGWVCMIDMDDLAQINHSPTARGVKRLKSGMISFYRLDSAKLKDLKVKKATVSYWQDNSCVLIDMDNSVWIWRYRAPELYTLPFTAAEVSSSGIFIVQEY